MGRIAILSGSGYAPLKDLRNDGRLPGILKNRTCLGETALLVERPRGH